ncbi:lambda-exonuclease family protein [Microbispora rosea]|uniref:lambda-exonuclease family protein n=1 Tax=Microbispora rosea TaxID=58117 RepID=UPI0037974D8B
MSDYLHTPTGRYLGRWATGSPEWHAARATRLGGSRIAALLGLSPWESPYSVWCQMAGLTQPGEQTKEQERGHYLEPAVAAWFADQHPEWNVFEAGTYVHRDRDWQLANPDRLIRYHKLPDAMPVGWYDIEVSALLEIKTDADGSGWGEPGTDQVPVYYRTQVQWYMDVLGLPRAHVAVLTPRLGFAEYVVDYDPDDAAALREAAESFLDSLLWEEMPDLDAHPATYAAVRDLHPDIDPDADYDADDELAVEFLTALADKAAADDREAEARTRLAAAMGTARRARWNNRTIATRQAKKGGTPYLVAGRKLPAVPAAITTTPDVSELAGAAA